MTLEIFRLGREVFQANYRAALLGFLLTPLYFYGIGTIFGVDIRDHWKFITSNYYQAEREKITQQLEQFNQKIDDYEIESNKKQEEIWQLLEKELIATKSNPNYPGIVHKSNLNQDTIRALLEFGKIYTTLVKTNQHTPDTHRSLSDMYEAFLDILKDEKQSYREAYDRLKSVNDHIEYFPEQIRDDVQIEVLRYLSFCAAKLKYTEQKDFTAQAAKIMKKKERNAKEYRRKFYWIDLSNLVTDVNNADFKKADEDFEKLRSNLADRLFLKMKLREHEQLIEKEKEYRDKWTKYITELN
jgi:hypothetical protein